MGILSARARLHAGFIALLCTGAAFFRHFAAGAGKCKIKHGGPPCEKCYAFALSNCVRSCEKVE